MTLLKLLFILLMNRNYHGYSVSSILQHISYFKNDVTLGENHQIDLNLVQDDVTSENDVIFKIQNLL